MSTKDAYAKMQNNKDFKQNFINLCVNKNERGFSFTDWYYTKDGYAEGWAGSNSGSWLMSGHLGEHLDVTPSHEFGHLLGYKNANSYDEHADYDPKYGVFQDIMFPTGVNSKNPKKDMWRVGICLFRVVRPETIARILDVYDLSQKTINIGRITNVPH